MNRDQLRKRVRKAFVKRGHGYDHIQQDTIQKVVSEIERQVFLCLQNNEEVMFKGFYSIRLEMQAGRRFSKGMNGHDKNEWMVKPGYRAYIGLSPTMQKLVQGDITVAELQVISQKQRQRIAVMARKEKK